MKRIEVLVLVSCVIFPLSLWGILYNPYFMISAFISGRILKATVYEDIKDVLVTKYILYQLKKQGVDTSKVTINISKE